MVDCRFRNNTCSAACKRTNKRDNMHLVIAPFRLSRVERVVRKQVDLERIPATPPPFRTTRPVAPFPVPRVVFRRCPQQSRQKVEARRGGTGTLSFLAFPLGMLEIRGACAPGERGGERGVSCLPNKVSDRSVSRMRQVCAGPGPATYGGALKHMEVSPVHTAVKEPPQRPPARHARRRHATNCR